MKVSDEIRNWCEFEDGTECGGFVTKASFDKLCALADRIDAELVELPLDRDGASIHVGDTVYLKDGRKAEVTRIDLMPTNTCIVYWTSDKKDVAYLPSAISHKQTDSFERIADELDAWVDRPASYKEHKEFHTFADRIRKLAKEGEHV